MKKLKLQALVLGADDVLSRSQMKDVLGGDIVDPSKGQCGTVENCSTGACPDGKGGTCGLSSHGTKCTCATVSAT